MPFSVLAELRVVRSTPDKVLRAARLDAAHGAEGGGLHVLVPANAAAALVLRHALATPPSLERLRELAAAATAAAKARP